MAGRPPTPVRLIEAAGSESGHVDALVANSARSSDQTVTELAVELIGQRITVTCIDPGPNDTGYASDEVRAYVAERHPGGRSSMPVDTAKLVGWLLSDEAERVTGQTIASDGGWSSR